VANVRGLRIPVGVGATGRTRTLGGDEQSRKVIRLGLSDTDNDNAFQLNIGLGVRHVFAVNSPSFRALIVAQIIRQFAVYEEQDLYRLDRTSIRWSSRTGSEDADLNFRYIDLETDEPQTFSRTFSQRDA